MRGHLVFFDLDGTITDPFLGIARCIAHALTALERPCPTDADLRSWIGPSLRVSFAAALGGGDPDLVERAVALYRERYAPVGIFECSVHDDIPELLSELGAAGARLFVATAKPLPYAERVLTHFGLRDHFEAVGGPELDGRRDDKAVIVAEILAGLEPGLRRPAVLVGDRAADVVAARANGIGSIAVTWGYAGAGELAAAAPDVVVANVGELRLALLG